MEPSFVVAEAKSEPVTPTNSHTPGDADSQGGTAWVEPSLTPDAAGPAIATTPENAAAADAAASATASISEESADPICAAVQAAAEEHDIPIGFFVRLLWQESRFRTREVSSAGAQGIAQFMPQTAVEMGLKNPFDPLQAIPASARFLRKLYDQFGNLGLAAAAYNAGGGRIAKWLSRRSSLPKETQAYVKIITGHKAEAWIDEESIVHMPTDLPQKAPCEGVGGLSRKDQIATVDVDLTPAASAMLRKVEADDTEDKRKVVVRKLRVASSAARSSARSRKMHGRTVVLAAKASRKQGKSVMRFAAESGRTKSSKAREL
ncbi:lytic transglycosylase domain-containing protein [Bradyrhizobium sp. WSM 1738]|nr:lytic transglycosylase domain-containing protein [Bradyrhizobium hereditatis]